MKPAERASASARASKAEAMPRLRADLRVATYGDVQIEDAGQFGVGVVLTADEDAERLRAVEGKVAEG